MKKVLSLVLVIALFFVMACPVSAEEDGNWLQVLGYSTVNNSNQNH